MKTKNRSYYCKQIVQAVEQSDKGLVIGKNELRFYDDLDWEVVEDRGVWTDVYFKNGSNSVFAFTACSSMASQSFIAGSVPEARRDLETGLWDLYIHKKYISETDVGNLCRKWLELQGPVKGLFMGCNAYFNDNRLGHVWTTKQYPKERLQLDTEDIYKLESFSAPIRCRLGENNE